MRDAAYMALVACAALLAWHAHGWMTPDSDPELRVDTLRVEADAPEPEEGTEPERRIIYRTRTDTVQQACFSLPQTYDTRRMSLVQPNPVTVEGRTVTLTRYETQTQRYVQDVFRVQKPRFSVAPTLYASADPYAQRVGAGVALRWGRVTLTPSYGVTQTDETLLTWRIRIRTTLRRWDL